MGVYKEFKKSGVGEINRHANIFGKNKKNYNNNNNLLLCTLLPHSHYPMMTHRACCRM